MLQGVPAVMLDRPRAAELVPFDHVGHCSGGHVQSWQGCCGGRVKSILCGEAVRLVLWIVAAP